VLDSPSNNISHLVGFKDCDNLTDRIQFRRLFGKIQNAQPSLTHSRWFAEVFSLPTMFLELQESLARNPTLSNERWYIVTKDGIKEKVIDESTLKNIDLMKDHKNCKCIIGPKKSATYKGKAIRLSLYMYVTDGPFKV
jgi:hypothetical protein